MIIETMDVAIDVAMKHVDSTLWCFRSHRTVHGDFVATLPKIASVVPRLASTPTRFFTGDGGCGDLAMNGSRYFKMV